MSARGAKSTVPPFLMSHASRGITHYTLQAKSYTKGQASLESLYNQTGDMPPSLGAYRLLSPFVKFGVLTYGRKQENLRTLAGKLPCHLAERPVLGAVILYNGNVHPALPFQEAKL